MNFEWTEAVNPRWGAVLHAIAWVLLVLWVWRRPRGEILKDAPDAAAWRDLRWWVVPLAAAQVCLYFLF